MIVPGGNYGWPKRSRRHRQRPLRAPLRCTSSPSPLPVPPSFRAPGTAWEGDYVFASLRGEALHRLVLENGRVVVDDLLLEGDYGRLRTVREGPDGDLYVLTSNRDGRGNPRPGDDRILRVRLPGPSGGSSAPWACS